MQMAEKYSRGYKLKDKTNSNKRNAPLIPASEFEMKVELIRKISGYTTEIVGDITDLVISDTIGKTAKGRKKSRYGR